MNFENKLSLRRRTLVAGAVAVVMAGIAPSVALAQEGSSLTFGLSATVGNLAYGPSRGGAQWLLNQQIHRGLVKYDENGQVVSALAESFEAIDPSTYSFTLRPGLKFHDGSAITAETVKASIEYLADKNTGAAIYAALATLASIEVTDELSLTIKLSKPNASFLEYLADPNAGISPVEALASGAENWVGAGPYKLANNFNGVSVHLVKADTFYANEQVNLDRLDFVFYPDSVARTNALLAGDVDAIDFVGWEDFERVKADSNLVLDAVSGPFLYTMFNTETAPFNDAKVRQAIAHAINRENVVAVAFYGNGTPLNGIPMSPNNDRYDPSMGELWSYDPDKARALLAEAGVAEGLSIRLLSSASYGFFLDAALSVQADLQAVGIHAELDAPDWATYMSQKGQGGYDLAIGGGTPSVSGPVYLQQYSVGAPASSFGSYGYDGSAIVAHIQAAEGMDSAEAARAEFLKATDLIAADVPFLPLAQRSQAFAYKTSVQGFKNVPGFLSLSATGYSLETATNK